MLYFNKLNLIVLHFDYIHSIYEKLTCSSWLLCEANNGAYEDEDEDEITIVESLQFNFDTIRVATSHFSDSNKLGQGGFGVVYRVRANI